MDDQPALAAAVADLHLGLDTPRKLVFQLADVVGRAVLPGFRRPADQVHALDHVFRGTDRQPALDHLARAFQLAFLRQPEQRPGMPHFQFAVFHQPLHRRRQVQEAQGVGHRRAGAAHRIRHFLVGESELLQQTLEPHGLLNGVEILALDVLDQGHRHGGLVTDLPHHCGDGGKAGPLGTAPAALAGDDLVAVDPEPPHQQRLDDALGADRVRQFLQRLLVHVPPGLIAAALEEFDGKLQQAGGPGWNRHGRVRRFRRPRRGGLPHVAQQGAQALAQSGFFLLGHAT